MLWLFLIILSNPSLLSLDFSPFSSLNCLSYFFFWLSFNTNCFVLFVFYSFLLCSKLKFSLGPCNRNSEVSVFIEYPEYRFCVQDTETGSIFSIGCMLDFSSWLTSEQGVFWSTWACWPDGLGMSYVICVLGTWDSDSPALGQLKRLAPILLPSLYYGFSCQVVSSCYAHCCFP